MTYLQSSHIITQALLTMSGMWLGIQNTDMINRKSLLSGSSNFSTLWRNIIMNMISIIMRYL